jgi:uncharacterized protein YndB with AHSA1/START domain
MSEYGVLTEAGTVRFRRVLPGPIERVWAFLTEPEKRATWFAGGAMELRPGGAAPLHFRHANIAGGEDPPEGSRQVHDGFDLAGRITECVAPRLLVMEWDGFGDGAPSEVTFELTAEGGKVILDLVHRRLGPAGLRQVSGGWHAHLAILEARLADAPAPPFWSTHARLAADYAARLGT